MLEYSGKVSEKEGVSLSQVRGRRAKCRELMLEQWVWSLDSGWFLNDWLRSSEISDLSIKSSPRVLTREITQ